MLRILQHIPKQFSLTGLSPTLRRHLRDADARREGLRRGWGERAPWVEFAVGPVRVAGADGPAAEDGVGAVGAGPVGEEVRGRGGELAVADVVLVAEGVVFGDELSGAEVGRLEVS